MAGTTSIRAVPDGVIVRNGNAEVKIWAHQVIPFCNFATDWIEQLEQRKDEQQ